MSVDRERIENVPNECRGECTARNSPEKMSVVVGGPSMNAVVLALDTLNDVVVMVKECKFSR